MAIERICGVVLAALAGALAAPALAAANDEMTQAACAGIYDAAACSCAFTAIAAAGAPEAPPIQLASDPAAVAPRAGMSRVIAFSVHDFAQVVQACMAPGRDTPAD